MSASRSAPDSSRRMPVVCCCATGKGIMRAMCVPPWACVNRPAVCGPMALRGWLRGGVLGGGPVAEGGELLRQGGQVVVGAQVHGGEADAAAARAPREQGVGQAHVGGDGDGGGRGGQ